MANKIWPFTTPANYVFDDAKIEVADGLAKLKRGTILESYANWHLNESSGAVAADSSGNGRDGSLVNMEDEDWKPGKLNNCLQFDGVNEHINLANIASFERTSLFSVEAWIKTSQKGIIIGKQQWISAYRGWYLAVNQNGYLQFILTNTWGTNQLSAYQDDVYMINNVWHHFVVTYDGSSSVVGVKFYVDGILRTTKGSPSTLSATVQNSIDCQMSGVDGLNELFAGQIDEVVIYDKELTLEEVLARWNGGDGMEGSAEGDYPTDKPTIRPSDSWQPLGLIHLTAFAETLAGGNQGTLGYQLSGDDGMIWLYWNGSSWTAAGDSDYNDQATIQANIGAFPLDSDQIIFKAFLISDGSQQVELSTIGITADKIIDVIQTIKAETDKIQPDVIDSPDDFKADVSDLSLEATAQLIKGETDKIQPEILDKKDEFKADISGNFAPPNEYDAELAAIQADLDNPDQFKADVSDLAGIKTQTDKIPAIKTQTDKLSSIKSETDKITSLKTIIELIEQVEIGEWKIEADILYFLDPAGQNTIASFQLYYDDDGNVIRRQRI